MPAKQKSIYKFLRKSAGENTEQAIGNLSSEIFSAGPEGNENWEVYRMLIQIRDGGSMDSGRYGNGVVLTGSQGVRVVILDSANKEIVDLLDGGIIQVNEDWEKFCFDVELSNYGAGDESLGVRWTFAKSGSPLHLTSGQKIAVICEGNFALSGHTFFIQGQRFIHESY